MPNVKLRRYWCKKCQEWRLFSYEDNACRICGSKIEESVKLSEIPKDKILEQRERYIDSRKKKGFLNMVLSLANNGYYGVGVPDFSPPQIYVKENDAGLIEENNKKYEEYMKKKKEKEAYAEMYKDVGRNEVCPCGSGLKFKKCCKKLTE